MGDAAHVTASPVPLSDGGQDERCKRNNARREGSVKAASATPKCGEVHNAGLIHGIELVLRSGRRKRILIIASLVVVTATIVLWLVYR
jgi:hypothetical protein